MGWLGFRRIDRELEARLAPPATGNASGKAERKWYRDGGERLKLRVRNLEVPDGAEVTVLIADRPLSALRVHGGRAKLDLEATSGADIPLVRLGETLVIEWDGKALLHGDFHED
jgi:hypothetical protein